METPIEEQANKSRPEGIDAAESGAGQIEPSAGPYGTDSSSLLAPDAPPAAVAQPAGEADAVSRSALDAAGAMQSGAVIAADLDAGDSDDGIEEQTGDDVIGEIEEERA